jgi:hypothetical protein
MNITKLLSYFLLLFVCVFSYSSGISKLVGNFTVNKDTNSINDKDASYISTSSIDGIKDNSIQWLCIDKQLKFIIRTPYSLHSSNVPVVHRFDSSSPSLVEQWVSTTTSDAAFLPAFKVSGFTRKAMKANKVVFQITDGDGTKHLVKYNITGLSNALKQLACAKKLFV